MKKALCFIVFFSSLAVYGQGVEKKINDLLERYNEFHLFNGSALAADSSGVVLEGGYGLANREWGVPAAADTKYRLASVSKQFTAMVILQLVDEGKLSLESKLSDVLPYYRKDTGEKVTIHHLLNHSSGIPSFTSHPDYNDKVARNPARVKEFVSEHASGDLEFEPGSQFSYNNSGYYLLGAIIEQVTGNTYAEAVKNRIFEPLGMENSGYDTPGEVIKKKASGYRSTLSVYNAADYIDMTVPYAAGALYSTVEDLYKWDRALYESELLSDSLKEKMFTPAIANYGYGFMAGTMEIDGESYKTIFHGGGVQGASSIIYRIPEKKQAVILLSNVEGTNLAAISTQIFDIMNGKDVVYPKQPAALYLLNRHSSGNAEELLEVYEAIKEDEAESFNLAGAPLTQLASALYEKGDKKDAGVILENIISEDSANFRALYLLGKVNLSEKDTAEGIKNLEKALDAFPGYLDAVNELAQINPHYKNYLEKDVDKTVLEQYIGTYEFSPQFKANVKMKDGKLFVMATGQAGIYLYPLDKSTFFPTVINAKIKFSKDDNGNISHLTLYQNGREMKAEKKN